MTGQHIITATRSHAKERLGRLADRLRGRDDLPGGPDVDLQDHGDTMDITEALDQLGSDEGGNPPGSGYHSGIGDATTWHPGLRRPPWAGASEPGQPAGPDDGAWNGQTLVDSRQPVPRRYVPEPLTEPAPPQPDPGPQADLGRCIIWRDAVRDHFVRQERAHGTITAGPPWYVEYARIYRKRTGLISVREPDFALHRWDHVVDEIVAQAREATEAEWAATRAAQDAHATCQEYAARHAGRSAA